MLNDREMKAIMESLLFVWGDPLTAKELAEILIIKERKCRQLLAEMEAEFHHHRRGIVLKRMDHHYQLQTREEHYPYLQKLGAVEKIKHLSNSSMETLAIIAYKQPITRQEIDSIRGVKSNSSIDTLMNRNLIQEVGRLDKIGKPVLFGTTTDFLKQFSLSSLADLPSLDKGIINSVNMKAEKDENEIE